MFDRRLGFSYAFEHYYESADWFLGPILQNSISAENFRCYVRLEFFIKFRRIIGNAYWFEDIFKSHIRQYVITNLNLRQLGFIRNFRPKRFRKIDPRRRTTTRTSSSRTCATCSRTTTRRKPSGSDASIILTSRFPFSTGTLFLNFLWPAVQCQDWQCALHNLIWLKWHNLNKTGPIHFFLKAVKKNGAN
jgi:hypothetical protein